MTRWLLLVVAVYVPHLFEEAITRMYDDPVIVAAYALLAGLSPRHAAYLVFQLTLVLALAMALLVSMRGRSGRVVLAGLALALVGESHHLVRAIVTHAYNPGLVTALPMLLVGLLLGQHLGRALMRGDVQHALPL